KRITSFDLYEDQPRLMTLLFPNLRVSKNMSLKFVLVGFNIKRVAKPNDGAPELLIDYLKLAPIQRRNR
ncbi:MAG: hypothetical protein P1V97_39875, partial [Planctomycetota bacterium]|nr:hypothetical protein [Planctomycetota bacterium]